MPLQKKKKILDIETKYKKAERQKGVGVRCQEECVLR